MAPIYKIAVIQLYPKPLDPENNYARAASFIASAAKQGAHLAVLPEYHLTNWVPQDPRFADQCAQWEDYLNRYRALAKEHNICIVPGTIVELHGYHDAAHEELKATENDRQNPKRKPILHNIAYFLSNTGEILGRYQKKNLWHPEREHLTSSKHQTHDAFDTPLGRVGMLICWDLAFPEAFRELVATHKRKGKVHGGAKILIVPTFWTLTDCTDYGLALNPRSEVLFLESTITARTFENTCCVVFVNAGGPSDKHDKGNYAGLSRVAMPFIGGKGEETMNTPAEGMSIVDVDMEVLEEAEKNYGVRTDLAKQEWHYTYRHQDWERL